MESSEVVKSILLNYLFAAPTLLVWLAGVLVSIVLWRKHPRVSLLALAGFGVALLVALAYGFVFVLLNHWLNSAEIAYDQREYYYNALRFVFSLVEAVAAVLIVTAVFTGRGPRVAATATATTNRP
ncbi:MAG TPA: hypothetical protein VFX96_15750 [Pyrinomonadaceae bacterium]|nr:hypothetical protein [Pyrinomonadaceae bacterium]